MPVKICYVVNERSKIFLLFSALLNINALQRFILIRHSCHQKINTKACSRTFQKFRFTILMCQQNQGKPARERKLREGEVLRTFPCQYQSVKFLFKPSTHHEYILHPIELKVPLWIAKASRQHLRSKFQTEVQTHSILTFFVVPQQTR